MNDLAQAYEKALFDGYYPPPPPEEVVAAATPAEKPKGSRQRAQENAPGMADAGTALMDMLAGALKGAVSQTIGLPGDIESLYRLIADGQQRIPTTEDIRALMAPVVPQDLEPRERVRREKTSGVFEELGSVAPISGLGSVIKRVKFGRDGKRLAATGSIAATQEVVEK